MKLIFLFLLSISLYANSYMVTKITDGDTIQVIDKSIVNPTKKDIIKVRLAFIDTMESVRNNRAKKLATTCNIDIEKIIVIGKQSKIYLSELIMGKEVIINFYGKDELGLRMVGEVFLINDIESINVQMVRHGYGLPYYKYLKKFNQDIEYYNWLLSYGSSKNNDILNNTCVLKSLWK